MERRRFRTPVRHLHLDVDVGRRLLRVGDVDVEEAVVGEGAGVPDLVFPLLPVPLLVLLDQVVVGERLLGILVVHRQERMGRRALDEGVHLLHVLPVVPLGAAHPEEALLQERIGPVPEGEGEAEDLVLPADPPQAVLVPAVGPAPRVVVGEIGPGVAVRAVILPDRRPGPIAQVGAPAQPRLLVFGAIGRLQALALWIHRRGRLTDIFILYRIHSWKRYSRYSHPIDAKAIKRVD